MTNGVLLAVLRPAVCRGSSRDHVVNTVTATRSCHRLQRRVSHDLVIAPLPPDITGMWVSKRSVGSTDQILHLWSLHLDPNVVIGPTVVICVLSICFQVACFYYLEISHLSALSPPSPPPPPLSLSLSPKLHMTYVRKITICRPR